MAKLLAVDEVPVEGKFSVEMYNGAKYAGPLEKKDLIIKWIVKTHKQASAYPIHVYESLDEIFISVALFLPDELMSNVSRYVETPRLREFGRLINKNKTYTDPKDKRRLDVFSIEDKFEMFYEFGKDGDIDSFEEVFKLYIGSLELDQYVEKFIRGMLERKHYEEVYLLLKRHKMDWNRLVGNINVYEETNPHFDAFQLILLIFDHLY